MKHALLALLFVISSAYAQVNVPEVVIPELNQAEGASFIEHQLKSAEALLSEGTLAFVSEHQQKSNFPMGDFAIMWGIGSSDSDQRMTKDEYQRIWRIMNYLSDKGFRVVMNTKTRNSHLKEVVETEGVSVVIYSGHGNTSGFYDFAGTRISYDLFANKARSLYQFILSACYGTESRGNYNPPADLLMYTWSGLTNSSDLEGLLMSDRWTGLEGKH